MDPAQLLERASKITGKVVAATDERSLRGRSPCKGWDGRAVLNHLVGSMNLFATAARGEPTDRAAEGAPDFPDLLGDDPKKAYAETAKALVSAFGKKGVLAQTLKLPTGELPGQVAAAVAFMELCVHGWDLARATRQDYVLPNAVGTALEQTAQMIVTDPLRKPPFFGKQQKAPAEASAIERVVAYTGRRI